MSRLTIVFVIALKLRYGVAYLYWSASNMLMILLLSIHFLIGAPCLPCFFQGSYISSFGRSNG